MESNKILEFKYEPLYVTLEGIMKENGVPKKRWYDFVLRNRKKKREELEMESIEEFDIAVKEYERLKLKAYEKYILENNKENL